MPIPRIHTTPARPAPRPTSLSAYARETKALIAKTDGRDVLTELCDTALLLKYQTILSPAGKQMLKMVRGATPAQAQVLFSLLNQRLNGGTYRPPPAHAALAKKAKAEIAKFNGADDLRALRLFALQQQYRTNLSPAGVKLLDRLRTATPAQAEVLYTLLNERVHGGPVPGRYGAPWDS